MARKSTPSPQAAAPSYANTLGELEAAFTQLPAKQVGITEMTTKEIVAGIKPALAGARKKHYSWEEIRDLFEQLAGRKIALVTLKSYMQENRTPTDGQYGLAKPRHKPAEPSAQTPATKAPAHQTTGRGRTSRKSRS